LDITTTALTATLVDGAAVDPDDLHAAFTGWVSDQGIALYPAQRNPGLGVPAGRVVVRAVFVCIRGLLIGLAWPCVGG